MKPSKQIFSQCVTTEWRHHTKGECKCLKETVICRYEWLADTTWSIFYNRLHLYHIIGFLAILMQLIHGGQFLAHISHQITCKCVFWRITSLIHSNGHTIITNISYQHRDLSWPKLVILPATSQSLCNKYNPLPPPISMLGWLYALQ